MYIIVIHFSLSAQMGSHLFQLDSTSTISPPILIRLDFYQDHLCDPCLIIQESIAVGWIVIRRKEFLPGQPFSPMIENAEGRTTQLAPNHALRSPDMVDAMTARKHDLSHFLTNTRIAGTYRSESRRTEEKGRMLVLLRLQYTWVYIQHKQHPVC